MTGKARASLLSLTIVVVIVFSAFGTTRVYADGGTTPDPPPTETASSSGEVNTKSIAAPADPSAEVKNLSEVPAEASAVPAEATAAPAADATVLDAVPDDTTVTVVDASGQAQSLATQAAAEAIAASDPMWCPTGVAPGGAGCTPSFTSFTALLNELSTNSGAYQGAGTIFVQQGAYTGGETTVDFNAYNLSNISSANLIVMGGWDGTSNPSGNPATPSTFNNTSLIIGGPGTSMWGGSLTLLNLSISNTSGTGLTLNSQQNITLVNVDVTNSTNGAGAELNAGGSVAIVDSNFTRNKTAGATIQAGSGGVVVVNSSFSNPANARRQNVGLDIGTTGPVTLIDVVANENRLQGTTINAGGAVSITRGFFSGTRELNNTGFHGYGLQVTTPTSIALESVTASNNFLWGASLATDGNISISNSIFNANSTFSTGFIDDTGLFITRAANVALNNVQANDNRLYGAQIGLLDPITGLPTVTGDVSIILSTFSNNRGVITVGGAPTYNGHGLQVNTQGSITFSNVTAENNMLFGAELNAGGAVDISNSTFNNNSTGVSSNAVGEGLEINTPGNVSLLNVTVNNNQTIGADIRAGGNVTLNNVTATNNGGDGVFVLGACALVMGGTFTGNGGIQLNLNGIPACALPLSVGNTSPTTTTNLGSSNVFISLPTASQQNAGTNGALLPVTGVSAGTSLGSASVTLRSVVSKAANGGLGHIFSGKYTYVYSDSGLQIFALSSKEVAMREAFRAY